MDLADAYRVMGLGADASLVEVERRRIELAREWHPDRGGSHEAMTQLWDACELVRSASERRSSSRGLVLRGDGALQLLPGVGSVPAPGEREQRSARALRELVRHQTSALRRAKRQRTWSALLIAGIGVVVSLLQTLGLDQWQFTTFDGTSTNRWISPQVRMSLVGVCTVLSLVLGVGAWRASIRAAWIEEALEDAADTMAPHAGWAARVSILAVGLRQGSFERLLDRS